MTFQPHPLLRGPHRQTIYGAFGRVVPELGPARAERFETTDGDFVDLEHLGPETGPRAVVLHGLGGSARSPYVRAMAAALVARGWAVTLFQFRGASGVPNRRARLYHSGDTADIAAVMAELRRRTPRHALVQIGYSLGGNVTLKLLGEQGTGAVADAAVAVSVPFDLGVCADTLARGSARVYNAYLLLGLKRVLARKRSIVAGQVDLRAALAAPDFRRWDGLVTAPLNGFSSAEDYYRASSSSGYLGAIAKPTLIVHAADDPFMTPEVVPAARALAPSVTLEVHPQGGHVGFIGRGPRGLPRSFVEGRVATWLERWLGE